MRICSRETLVGFLLLMALGVGGCQPVQPVLSVSATEAAESDETVVESEPITDTFTLTETLSVSSTESVTVSVVVNAAGTMSETVSGSDPALLEAGQATYRAQYCGICHTLDAAETRGTFGPTHNGMGEIAALQIADPTYNGNATTPAEYIRESIVEPQLYIVPGYATTSHRMPSYAHLDAVTLDALVAFLLAQ